MTKRQVRLECAECKNINYLTFKNAKNVTEKLTLNKFCNHCRKVTKHTETKKK
ncbi:MAG: 50S ribosomal protein L33 [Mycoplasmataceae bacterium]|nr:50S ribosomal protein L33 [Mycoplasmataceae bacterium]